MDPDGAAAKEAVDPEFASGAAVADAAGTRDNAFEEDESEREPSKSISTLLVVAGAAKKKYKDIRLFLICLIVLQNMAFPARCWSGLLARTY